MPCFLVSVKSQLLSHVLGGEVLVSAWTTRPTNATGRNFVVSLWSTFATINFFLGVAWVQGDAASIVALHNEIPNVTHSFPGSGMSSLVIVPVTFFDREADNSATAGLIRIVPFYNELHASVGQLGNHFLPIPWIHDAAVKSILWPFKVNQSCNGCRLRVVEAEREAINIVRLELFAQKL